MTELPDECDFCDQVLDDDEDLVPVWVGEPSEPKTECVQKVQKKPSRRVGGDERFIFNKPASEWIALWRALQECESVDVHTADRVLEPDPVWARVDERPMIQTDGGGFDDDVNDDKAGATVTVKPPSGHDDPDMELCEYCAESFRA